ncbi:uncharacterized protein [Henckelia pumila]|uniref:uncharacterized protein n=1 Tax=Henckelia pumila TaxID=405737 RepID=UPI003C6E3F70
MKSGLEYKEYIGGQFEYFDYVDRDKLGMIELWGYAEDVGCPDKCIKFWHKFGENLKDGRYLENDIDVMDIIPHIPKNYEVEIYIERNDGASSQMGLGSILIRMETGIGESEIHNHDSEVEDVDAFNESDYELDELFDTFIDCDACFSGNNDDGNIYENLLSRMQQNEGDDDCVNDDVSGSPLNSDEDDDDM